MRIRAWTVISASILLASCGGSSGGSSPDPGGTPPPPPTNTAPQASDLSIRTNESEAISDTLPASDADGDPLTFSIPGQPQKGQISMQSTTTGNFTYTPAEGEFGSDTFTFTVSDGTDSSNTGTVTIDINRIPVANEVRQTISSVNLAPWDGSLDASDPDGDALTYTFIDTTSKGTLSNTDTSSGTFTYTPDPGQTGTDGFQYEVTDGLGVSNTEWVIVTFNAPPSAGDGPLDVLRDQANSGALSATDPENDGVVFSIVDQPAKGSVSITDPNTGTYIYTPVLGEIGTDSFTYVANDAYSTSNPATISVTIYDLPTVGFVTTDSYAPEDKTEFVSLAVSDPIPFDIQVSIQIDGTATNLDDYEILTPLPMHIPAMSTAEAFEVAIVGDGLDEDEFLDLTITSVSNGAIDNDSAIHTLLFTDWRGTQELADFHIPIPGRALSNLTIDANGNIYVAGQSPIISAEKRQDAVVQKYDKRGVSQWFTYIGGLNETAGRESEYATGIAVNASEEVFVSGTEGYSNSIDGFLVKLDANGTKTWHETMVGFGGQDIRGLALDTTGNPYVVGYTSGSLNGEEYFGSTDALIVKFDSDGNTIWTRIVGSSGNYEVAQDIKIGSTGDLFVSGMGNGAMFGQSSPGQGDIFLTRYTPDGNMIWGRAFGSVDTDAIGRIALDASDSVYIAGNAGALISRPGNTWDGNDTLSDELIAKFDADGTEQWIRMTAGDSSEHAYGIAVDSLGLIYVTGGLGGPTFVARYNSAGLIDWRLPSSTIIGSRRSGGPIMGGSAEAIAEDNEGNFFVIGIFNGVVYLMKMDASGQVID